MCRSHVCSTPAIWNTLKHSKPTEFPFLRTIALGGEFMTPSLLKTWRNFPGIRLFNTYGVTEGTIYQFAYEFSAANDAVNIIGKPYNNMKAFILNEQLQMVEDGAVGELCLSGPQLAIGYLKNIPFTLERFILLPKTNCRIYKTGDMARKLGDNYQLLGRKDLQIKLNGRRIELEEISSTLLSFPFVHNAITLLHEEKLIAYITSFTHSQECKAAFQIVTRAKLMTVLPHYLIPNRIHVLDVFPLNSSGKVDRCALVKLDVAYSSEFPVPQQMVLASPSHKLIANIWCEVLHADHVDGQSNFFDLGGVRYFI